MRLAVTIKRDEDLEQLRPLIAAIRTLLTAENVTVLEAPKDFDYPYPFPVVTISEGPNQGRHFGAEAVKLLRSLSQSRQLT
jgi:hypothetical protein